VVTLGAGLQRHAGDLFVPVAVVFFDFKVGSGRRDLQKLPAQCELLCPVPIGEEAVVANTLKSFGENVEQEPTDELGGRRGAYAPRLHLVATGHKDKSPNPLYRDDDEAH